MTGSGWAKALCAHNDKCDAAFNTIVFGSTSACVTGQDKSLASAKAAPDTGVTDAALDACAAAIQALDCATPANQPDACIFKGKRPLNAGCAINEQCQTGYCLFTTQGDCGKCGTPGIVDDACDAAPCGIGLDCDQNTNKCAPRAKTGASCATVSCASANDRCVKNVCVAGGAKGAACTAGNQTDQDSCGPSLECVNNVCAQIQATALANQTCGNGVQCVNGECIDTKCVANLAEGAACNDEASDDGPFCGGVLECIDLKCAYEPTVATCN